MVRRIIDRLAAAFGGAEPDYVAEIAAAAGDPSYRFIRPSDEFWSVAKTYPVAP